MNGCEKGLLSVCCLGYNHAKFAADCIKAIWDSDYKKIEIVVVDDGSTDDSTRILLELSHKSPLPMRLILQKNTGNVGRNLNNAWRAAQGEFIAFTSLDDILITQRITESIHDLLAHPAMAFVASSTITFINDDGSQTTTAPPDDEQMPHTIEDLLECEYRQKNYFYLQGTVFRKSIVDAVGGFDEDMTGDDLILRHKVFLFMRQHPEWEFKIVPEPAARYRQHAGNLHLNCPRQLKIISQYLDRYWPDRGNPDFLYSWIKLMISTNNWREITRTFITNRRIAMTLANGKVLSMLVKKMFKWLYWREKNRGYVTLTFFSAFHIVCRRKTNKNLKAEGCVFISVVRDIKFYERCVRQNPANAGAQFVAIDNRAENLSIPTRYNSFLDSWDYKKEAWFIFCHEDFKFIDPVGGILEFADRSCIYGMQGHAICAPHRIVGHWIDSNRAGDSVMIHGAAEKDAQEVFVTDPCCMIVHSSLVNRRGLRFDTNLPWDLYTEDFEAQAHEQFGISTFVLPVMTHHYSHGDFGKHFWMARRYLVTKHTYDKAAYYGITCWFGNRERISEMRLNRMRKVALNGCIAMRILRFLYRHKHSKDGYFRLRIVGIPLKFRHERIPQ